MKPYPLSLLNHFTVPTSGMFLLRAGPACQPLHCSSPCEPHRKCCNVRAGSLSLPDQSPIDSDSPEAKRLVKRDRRAIKVIDEEGHALPFPGQMTAHLAQHIAAEASPPILWIGPDAHELDRLRGYGRVLALGYDSSAMCPDQGAFLVHQLPDAFTIAGGIAFQWIDSNLLGVHRSTCRNEDVEIAHGGVADFLQVRKVEAAADGVDGLIHPDH